MSFLLILTARDGVPLFLGILANFFEREAPLPERIPMDHENMLQPTISFFGFLQQMKPRYARCLRRLVPTRHDAADVMQGIALVLWRKFGELDEPDNFRKWSFGVARYETLAWLRDKARDRLVLAEDLLITMALESSRNEESLSASVPPEGVGFAVDTPDAEVIDFGTEFSIDVESNASEVHVFEGLVRVQPRSLKDGKAGQAVNVQSSQAVKIDNASKKPVGIQLATDRFIRSFDEPKTSLPPCIKSAISRRLLPDADSGQRFGR